VHRAKNRIVSACQGGIGIGKLPFSAWHSWRDRHTTQRLNMIARLEGMNVQIPLPQRGIWRRPGSTDGRHVKILGKRNLVRRSSPE